MAENFNLAHQQSTQSSCMGQTLEIVINSFQSRPESVHLTLVKIAINLICQLLLLCYVSTCQILCQLVLCCSSKNKHVIVISKLSQYQSPNASSRVAKNTTKETKYATLTLVSPKYTLSAVRPSLVFLPSCDLLSV